MASFSVCNGVGASKDSFGANVELGDTLIPALDDLANSKLELELLSSSHARIEDFSVSKLASVVHLYLGAFLRELTSAFLLELYLEAARETLNVGSFAVRAFFGRD